MKAQKDDLIVHTLSVSCGSSYHISGVIYTVPVTFVLDTGAAVSLIREDVWTRITKTAGVSLPELREWRGKRLVGVNGSPLSVRGFGKFQVFLGDRHLPAEVTLIITSDLTVQEAILGLDFVETYKCVIDCGRKTLSFPFESSSVNIQCGQSDAAAMLGEAIGLVMMENAAVPPASEMEVLVKYERASVQGTWIVESDTSNRPGVIVARGLVCPDAAGLVPIRVLNPRDEKIILKQGVQVAKMEFIGNDCVLNVSAVSGKSIESRENQERLWEMVCEAGNSVNDNEKEQLFALVMEYADVFSLSSSELGRTTVLKHCINTGDSQPVHLPPRRIPQARREEVRLIQEMLDQGVIQHSDSPWSSPVVLTKKKDGSLRFCVDYRKVNEVTKKDAYPLPKVDDTLDTLVG